ncbi:WecB/TagA/CpsF family glycosyltransferase [Planococcus maritimus]|uniref:N-acetylglucosaminyldiphosphoundecaprenol N-acetyl-beta-D-mannosaminyltransferase n=1 Tax=Planococcus maritimus TaxID=192421 RepID=A0A7D7RVM9_PLAMR|nr:WecB/TagA/CpsF family glycosyltransferase [Planococcus maritimus]QMT16862.1 WecB/TagA/CpsF family glycosyltransferase [Planococcus maritimus]
MKEEILGVTINKETEQQLLDKIQTDIEIGRKSRIVAINPEKVMMASKDPALRTLLNESTYQIPDGVGIKIASRMRGGEIRERVTGIGMMDALLQLAHKHGHRIFMYGAKKATVELAAQNIQKKYPNLVVAGTLDGYEKDPAKIIETINAAQPQILFVALGSPKQELFIRENMEQLNVNIFQGVGGSFDVYSGNVKRAPKLFLNTGTEWLYRLASQPTRIKRQMALPQFLIKAVRDKGGSRR